MARLVAAMAVCTVLSACAKHGSDLAQAPVQEAPADDRPFYQTLETPPAPVLTPAQALDTFVIAPGFSIELAAAEPLVEDPVAADWDEQGRLYVAEMRAYMTDTEGTGEEEPIGAVVRLSDTDGDGSFDQRDVLINDLVLPRALRIVNEGLLIGEMGKLWLCPSSTGWSDDIDCSARQYLGVYGEHQGSVEHAENGLLVGLDNWLYSAKSSRRLKLVDGALVEEPTLFRGQWGITQDDDGRLYYNTNSNLLLGDFYDAQAVIAAGNRTGPGLNTRISPDDEVFSIRVNPGVNRAYVPGVLREDGRLRSATSASGMVVYRGGRFGADDPDSFVAEPAANLVAAFKLQKNGLDVSAEHQLYPEERWGQRDFLASTDERFRPVDVLNGPDGALYLIDFYRGVIQDHVYLSDELKAQALQRKLQRPVGMGRIWRISKTDAEAAPVKPDWRALDTAGLVAQLRAGDIWRRATAQRLLLRSVQPDVAGALRELVAEGPSQAAVHGLWTLAGRDELDASVIQTALGRDERVAEAALLAGGHLLPVAKLLDALAGFNAGSRVYLYNLAALRHHIDDERALSAVQQALLASREDAHIRSFVAAAVRGREQALIRELVESGQWRLADEESTGFLAHLTQQLFRAEGAGAATLLSYVAQRPASQMWVQSAILNGLFETTREPGFQRAELTEPHELFGITDETLWPLVSKARRGFTWPGDKLAADAKPLTPQQSQLMARGEEFFTSSCANCHGADGAGVGALGPPLAESVWVTQAPERLARIVLHGLQGPIEVAGKTWNSAMPGHQDYEGFDNRLASGLLTYLRRAWGHSGRAISPEFIATVREQTADRNTLWTAAELQEININTHFAMYAGSFGRPDSPITFSYDGRQLIVGSGIFNGPLIELKEDHFLFEPRGLKLEFVVADDGSVPAVVFNPGPQGMTLPRVGP